MPALSPSSGTQAFNPSMGEFVIEAYSRLQIRPPSFTRDHFFQARMSAGLLFSEFANIGFPLLWKLTLLQIPLIPGVTAYPLPPSAVAPLDAFVRQYQLGNTFNFAPSFTAAVLSTSMQVKWPAHGLSTGQLVWFATQQTCSGVLVQGAYLVTSIVDQNNFEITLPTQADGTNFAVLPTFYTTAGSPSVTVFLPAHGLANGQTFYVNVPTTVGGILLNGGFTVIGVPTGDSFIIQGPTTATSTVGSNFLIDDFTGRILTNDLNGQPLTIGAPGQTLNGGQVQTQTQAYGVDTIDFILYPISRTEYAEQPDKQLQYRPTTYWINRQVTPVVNFWNVPDNNGPYVLNIWVMQQNDDPVIEGGVGVDVPFRWYAAFAAGLASRLSQKFPPQPPITPVALEQFYQMKLDEALREDIERVPFYIHPGMSGYWR